MFMQQAALHRFRTSSGAPAPTDLIGFWNFSAGATPWGTEKVSSGDPDIVGDAVRSVGGGVSGTDALASDKSPVGVSDLLTYTNATVLGQFDFDWGSTDFCIQGWMMLPTSIDGSSFYLEFKGGTNEFCVYHRNNAGSASLIVLGRHTASQQIQGNNSCSITLDVPYHWYAQYTHASDRIVLGVNGVVVYNSTAWTTTYIPDFSRGLASIRIQGNNKDASAKWSQLAVHNAVQFALNPSVSDSYTPPTVPIWTPA